MYAAHSTKQLKHIGKKMGSNGKNLTSLNGDGLDRGGKWEIRAFMMLSILVLCGKLADNCN